MWRKLDYGLAGTSTKQTNQGEKKKTSGSLKGSEKPVKTCETAVTGMVLPQVAIFHTVPVHVTPVTKIPRVYLYPCYSLV
jgi:hypothetical protein